MLQFFKPKKKKKLEKRSATLFKCCKAFKSQTKVLLCVQWGTKGLIHYEFLKINQTINSDLSCEQLGQVKQNIIDNDFYNNNVILLQDNARPHVSRKTLEKLAEFGWEVLARAPTCSPAHRLGSAHLLNGSAHDQCIFLPAHFRLIYVSRSEEPYRLN